MNTISKLAWVLLTIFINACYQHGLASFKQTIVILVSIIAYYLILSRKD